MKVNNNIKSPLLIVYYREGCHLCEQVVASLFQLQEELGYKIEQIDIDTNSKLREKYHVDVPVVTYRGEVIFYHFFDEIQLRKALANDSSKSEYT